MEKVETGSTEQVFSEEPKNPLWRGWWQSTQIAIADQPEQILNALRIAQKSDPKQSLEAVLGRVDNQENLRPVFTALKKTAAGGIWVNKEDQALAQEARAAIEKKIPIDIDDR